MRSQTFIQGALSIPQKLEARRTIAISREAASHQTHRLQQPSLVCRRERTHSRKYSILQASTSKFEEELKEVKEEADSKLPDVPKLDKKLEPPSFGNEKPSGIPGFFHTVSCYLRHKAWVAALGMYYLYNQAVERLPWIQIKRFEEWFWTTTRRKWIDSSSAATVLARQYVRSLKKGLSFSKTAAVMEKKKEEVEEDAQEKMEETKHDIDEAVNNPGKSLQRTFSNGARKLQEGPLKGPPAFLEDMSDIAYDLKQKVPMLRSEDASEDEGYEREERSSVDRETSFAASAPGGVFGRLTGKSKDRKSKEKAANEGRAEGKAKKRESDREAMKHMSLGRSFLGLFRKENESAPRPSEQEASGRAWSLPIPFWKRS